MTAMRHEAALGCTGAKDGNRCSLATPHETGRKQTPSPLAAIVVYPESLLVLQACERTLLRPEAWTLHRQLWSDLIIEARCARRARRPSLFVDRHAANANSISACSATVGVASLRTSSSQPAGLPRSCSICRANLSPMGLEDLI